MSCWEFPFAVRSCIYEASAPGSSSRSKPDPACRHDHACSVCLRQRWQVFACRTFSILALYLRWSPCLPRRRPRRSVSHVGGLQRREPSDTSNLEDVADQFATVVREQWEEEVLARRLNDPYPLPVRWLAADPSVVDTWARDRVARHKRGLSRLRMPGLGGPDDLAGQGSDLASALERVPTGRLVVLGELGSAKTMWAVRLILDLLEHRARGGPVPVLVSVASWDPKKQGLRDWLKEKLSTTTLLWLSPRSLR